jgi:hypothetical protein
MGKEFEIRREIVMHTTPQEAWDAVTTATGAWLWPMEYEPRTGGAAAFGGTVTVWDPPHHLASRVEGPEGWFNQVETVVEGRAEGKTYLRWVHSGIFTDDWDNQYDGANQHTDFYLHTLEQYLLHFSRRPVTYASADGPAASNAPDGFAVLRNALGLTDATAQGDTVRVDLPGTGPVDAVVDYLHPHFLGLRTADAMYRFFGRNAFGAPVGIAVHSFAGGTSTDGVADDATGQAWQSWVNGVYAA